MWKITYSIDYHYRNRDNYGAMDIGEVDEVNGDTLEEAIENLRFYLDKNGRLECIINAEARNLSSYDEYHDISIISVDEIVQSADIEIMEHHIFAKLVSERKAEIEKEDKEKERKRKKAQYDKDMAELKRLKAKLEG